ncbi:MAG: AraC family transcriptional regulator [Ginsengibacter sp.]
MRLLETQITPFIDNFLHIERREQPYFYSPHHGQPSFHSHPEFELSFIMESSGKRIIGNNVANYGPGDMVFIGSHVPHLWLSDPVYYKQDPNLIARCIVAYIHPKIFEPMFNHIAELDQVKEMIHQSKRGISIHGETQKEIGDRLISLTEKTGFEKVEGLLRIMHIISESSEKKYILNDNPTAVPGTTDRMNDVIEFIKNNLNEQITLEQAAAVACLTIPSFCRFFKKRTKMTFFQYLTKLRIAHACKLLIEMDRSVSYIANMCGYNSDSHFCKVFKDHIGQSPHQYKSSVNSSI